MLIYSLMLGKLALGLLCLIVQINLLGKGNLAPNSATDQVQNYVLGGIIGGVIYNNAISILDFLLVLIAWTLLVLVLKYLKMNSGAIKDFVDGSPAVVIERGKILMDECMRHGMLAHDIMLKLRMAGVYYVKDVKRAVLEPNGQVDEDILELIEKDRVWLNAELRAADCAVKDIYIGEYKDGELIVHPYEKIVSTN